MGDHDTDMISETSAVMGYTSGSYTSTDYSDANSNVVPDTSAFPSKATGDFAAPAALADINSTVPGGFDLGDGNIYSTDPNPILQEAHVSTSFEAKPAVGVANTSEKVTDLENAATELSQAAGNISSVDVSVGETGTLTVENGNSSDNMARAADEQQFDGFGMFFYLQICYIIMSGARWLWFLFGILRLYIAPDDPHPTYKPTYLRNFLKRFQKLSRLFSIQTCFRILGIR